MFGELINNLWIFLKEIVLIVRKVTGIFLSPKPLSLALSGSFRLLSFLRFPAWVWRSDTRGPLPGSFANRAAPRKTVTMRTSTGSSGMNDSTERHSLPCKRLGCWLKDGVWNTTRSGRTAYKGIVSRHLRPGCLKNTKLQNSDSKCGKSAGCGSGEKKPNFSR